MKKYTASIILATILLIIWEIVARVVDLMFVLPSPIVIGIRLWSLKTELLFTHLPATLLIILVGLAISIILGIFIAIMMNLSALAERAIYPILITSQTIPVIALAPIFVLWFGYSIWGKVMMTILLTFFPITVSTVDGFRSTCKKTEDLLLTMGATKMDIFLKLRIPSALPHFLSGLKIAVPLSVIGAAIGEWLGAQSGLGYFSRRMMTQLDGAAVFAPIVLLSLVGVLLFSMIICMERVILKWRE